jgi:hypothetical protein
VVDIEDRVVRSDETMAKQQKDHLNRLSVLAAKIDLPQVVGEIDKVLNEMRQEWFDMMDLRRSAVRRHGDRGLPIPLPPMEEPGPPPAEIAQASAKSPSDWTTNKLMDAYKNDAASAYPKLGFKSRMHYNVLMAAISKDHPDFALADINARVLKEWHAAWSEGGKIAVAHSKIGMLRRLVGFGASVLEDAECLRIATVMHTMRFKVPKRRTERLTVEQVSAIRAKAHERSRPSVALAQAFQFDLGLTQKTTIGEWVPEGEPVESDIVWEGFKWVQGIRWSDIDDNMVLTFRTPWQDEPIVANLRQSPMIMEELRLCFGFQGDRSWLPKRGAVIISEHSKRPWEAVEFRRWWRLLADTCGVPKNVRNMDSRPKIGRRPSQDYEGDEEEMEDFADVNELSSLH